MQLCHEVIKQETARAEFLRELDFRKILFPHRCHDLKEILWVTIFL